MNNSVKTPKGTILPLLNLKGKAYLQVAHRLVWFVETESRYTINTEYLVLNDEQTVARVVVHVYDDQGKLIKTAVGTKRETKKDFSDHTEKAETGALGRALVQLGYGTQYALADLDEGTRLADAPVIDSRLVSQEEAVQKSNQFNGISSRTVNLSGTKNSFKNGKVVNGEEEF